MSKSCASADSVPTAQTCLKIDLLSSLTPNARLLVVGLFRTAARRPNVRDPRRVVAEVHKELATRTMRALGESEGQSYSDALTLLCDHSTATLDYARACLVRSGKQVKA